MAVRYVAVVQCDLVMRRCSGVACEHAFWGRSGAFADTPADDRIRYTAMTCSGCCGRSLRAKLTNLRKRLKSLAGIEAEEIAVHFASCVCKDSVHAPPCPHLDYLKTLVERSGLTWQEGTHVNAKSEARRDAHGVWCRPTGS